MRQTIGGTWVFALVIIFTMIFASYIALTINYSRSFRVKNEVLSIIEKSQGFTNEGVSLINNYLSQSGYKTLGKCRKQTGQVVYGVKSISGMASSATVEKAQDDVYYFYCFSKVSSYHSYYKTRAYYRVTLFFHFDLPLLGDISTFEVDGQTSEIDATYDTKELKNWNH